MTTDSKKQKQELGAAIKQYLSQAEMHPIQEALELTKFGDFAFVFGMEDKDLIYFLVPADAELKLMGKIDKIFNSQVGPRTVRSQLNRTVEEIGEFPFSTNEKEEKFNDKLFKLLNFHFERQYDAIVPLYQIECSVKFPLANAVLHPSGSQSELSQIANDATNSFRDDDKAQIENCSFLKFRVTGDNDSRLKQVDEETQQALQVLRYIYPWSERDGKAYNVSHGVSMWKQSWRTILFQSASSKDSSVPWSSGIPPGILHPLSEEIFSYANEWLSLDEVNFHFGNRGRNTVSQRFCRAFQYFDIASQSAEADIALANYIICIDILLPSGNAEELTENLMPLIEKGGRYEGKMILNEDLSDPNSTEWAERVRLTVSKYKDFYNIRNKVVHGNTMRDAVSHSDVKQARQIAKSAIRAYAHLARAFNWQTDKEAKDWFKNPCKPPEKNSP